MSLFFVIQIDTLGKPTQDHWGKSDSTGAEMVTVYGFLRHDCGFGVSSFLVSQLNFCQIKVALTFLSHVLFHYHLFTLLPCHA